MISMNVLSEAFSKLLVPVPILANGGTALQTTKVGQVAGKTIQMLPCAISAGAYYGKNYLDGSFLAAALVIPSLLEGAKTLAQHYKYPTAEAVIECVDQVVMASIKTINIALMVLGLVASIDFASPLLIAFYSTSILLNLYLHLSEFFQRTPHHHPIQNQ